MKCPDFWGGIKRRNMYNAVRKTGISTNKLAMMSDIGDVTRVSTFYWTTEKPDLRSLSRSGIGSESAQKEHGSQPLLRVGLTQKVRTLARSRTIGKHKRRDDLRIV